MHTSAHYQVRADKHACRPASRFVGYSPVVVHHASPICFAHLFIHSFVCVLSRERNYTLKQSDILERIKKDNYELTDDMQKKLSAVCDEFTSSFTG